MFRAHGDVYKDFYVRKVFYVTPERITVFPEPAASVGLGTEALISNLWHHSTLGKSKKNNRMVAAPAGDNICRLAVSQSSKTDIFLP